MNFNFLSPADGQCLVKLWTTGRFGFSLPKKIEISTPAGGAFIYLYHNRRLRFTGAELTNATLARIAVARFLNGNRPVLEAEITHEMPIFQGKLIKLQSSRRRRVAFRVRAGESHPRALPNKGEPSDWPAFGAAPDEPG